MPTDFPIDSAIRIARAVLGKSFTRELIPDVGLLIEWIGRQIGPRQFGAGIDPPLSDDDLAAVLLNHAEDLKAHNVAAPAPSVEGLPLTLILKMLAKLILAAL